MHRVAVCSRSFSAHPVLRQELGQQFPEVTFNDTGKTLSGAELVEFLKGHSAAIVALETIDEAVLKQVPELRVVGKYGVGLDKLDFQAMDHHGVKLGWTPGVNAQSVAELTMAFILTIVRNIQVSNHIVKTGEWRQTSGKQLSSLCVGILGCGHVGKALVKLLRPFGCKILVHDIVAYDVFYKENAVQAVGFEELLSSADVLSVHIPKNQSTENLLDRTALFKMKKGSFFVNTARGGLVDESALLEMLKSGHLAGAALDVFAEEPPKNRELLNHPHLFATAHIGGSSEEAVLAMGRAAILGLTRCKTAGEYGK
jgi:D-3-phosphoglycerate dehydrogenase